MVGTPIGNLGDITLRALEVLKGVDVIVAEDTRTTLRLFSLLGLKGKKRFIGFDQFMEEKKSKEIVELIEGGIDVALVSEAGCPCISDPGQYLVRICRERGIDVVVVPGPSAPIVALISSGFPSIPFTFLGFLPRKGADKKRLFSVHGTLRTTLIFFERKSRLRDSLKVAFEVLGERDICIVREMTKLHEEVIYSSLSKWNEIEDIKGEITVVIAPCPYRREKTPEEEIMVMLRRELNRGGRLKEIVDRVQKKTKGWDKKTLYNFCIRLK